MTKGRDYSEVVWPWEGDPHWVQPREGATSDPSDSENWALACRECALQFPEDIQIQVVADHHVELHGAADDARRLELDLVWRGLGAPPEKRS